MGGLETTQVKTIIVFVKEKKGGQSDDIKKQYMSNESNVSIVHDVLSMRFRGHRFSDSRRKF
jgi:hypothetical protein